MITEKKHPVIDLNYIEGSRKVIFSNGIACLPSELQETFKMSAEQISALMQEWIEYPERYRYDYQYAKSTGILRHYQKKVSTAPAPAEKPIPAEKTAKTDGSEESFSCFNHSAGNEHSRYYERLYECISYYACYETVRTSTGCRSYNRYRHGAFLGHSFYGSKVVLAGERICPRFRFYLYTAWSYGNRVFNAVNARSKLQRLD